VRHRRRESRFFDGVTPPPETSVIASLDVIVGPMFAGKTSALIARVRALAEEQGLPALIVKPAMDTRYGADAVVTHDGVSWRAVPVSNAERIVDLVAVATRSAHRPVHVFADEVQFFDAPHFDGAFHVVVHALLREGHPVTCAGLDLDWRGMPFDVSARLLAMADHVVKLKARCTVTGAPAAKTFKKTATGERIELGAGDLYEPRANTAWSVGDVALPMPRRAAGA